MASAVTVLDSFLSSAYELPKECSRKVFKALKNLVNDPQGVGLHLERIGGKDSGLWSIRVDDDYRIILRKQGQGFPTVLFVGKHDTAYQFAERRTSTVLMNQIRGERPLYQELPDANPLERMVENLAGDGKTVPVDLDDLESMVTTHKYLPLARVLIQESRSEVRYSFDQIELAISDALPPSARKYRAWWANERSPGTHTHATAWLGVGWRVGRVDFDQEEVSFIRH